MKKLKYIFIIIFFILLPLLSTMIYDQYYLNLNNNINLDDSSPTSYQGLQLILDIRTYSNPMLAGKAEITFGKQDDSKQKMITQEIEKMCQLKIFSSYQKKIIDGLLASHEYNSYVVNDTPFEIIFFQNGEHYISLKIDWNINKIIGYNLSAYKPLTSSHYQAFLEYLQLDTINDFTEVKNDDIYYISKNTQLIIRPYIELRFYFGYEIEALKNIDSIGLEIINYEN